MFGAFIYKLKNHPQFMEELRAVYEERALHFEAEAAALRKKYNYYSFIRLTTFFAAIGVAIYLFAELWQWGLVFTLLFMERGRIMINL